MLLSLVLLQSSQVEDYGGVRGWVCVCVYIQYHTYISYYDVILFHLCYSSSSCLSHGQDPVTEFIPFFSKTRHTNR